jgi:hypothetical protein
MSIFLGNLFEGFVEGATSNELSVLEGVAKQAKKDYDNAKKAYDNAKKAYDKSAKTYGDANKKSLKSCADSAKKPNDKNKKACASDTAKTASIKTTMDSTNGIMQNAKGVLDAKKNALNAANKAVSDYKKQSKSGSKKSKSKKKKSKSKSGKKKSKSKSKKNKSKKKKSKKKKSKKKKSKKKSKKNKSKKNRSKKNKSKNSKNDLKKCNRDKTQCGLDLGTEKKKVVKLTEENNRLITKNNSLLDTVQYYRKNLFGSSSILGSMLGYKDATIQANQEIDQLKHKEIGTKQSLPQAPQGFENKEGFDSMDAAYKSVSTQNAALENQINTKRNNYSVDDQVYMNMAGKRNNLIYVNSILMWLFYAVVTVCSIYIAIDPTMSTEKKFVVFKLVWLFVVILEIAEYLLYYAVQYAKAFLTGVPYSFENYWTYTLTF